MGREDLLCAVHFPSPSPPLPGGFAHMSPIQPHEVDVLVVDDESTLRSTCRAFLEGYGYNVTAVERAEDAVALLKRRAFHILLLDLYMPQISGLELLTEALELHPEAKVIMMTGNPSVETSDAALRAGAFDYIPKPFSATHLEILVDRALHALSDDSPEVTPEDAELGAPPRISGGPVADSGPGLGAGVVAHVGGTPILGHSKVFRNVVELARRVAATDASVFITGESGTGKELIAQYIHQHSARSNNPLVEVNCAAIPESLFESEMFGHRREDGAGE